MEINEDLVYLRAVLTKLHSLSDEAWSAALPYFTACKFDAGAHIIKAGDIVSQIFFQTSGLARAYYLNKNGTEFNKSFAHKNHVISSISSLICKKPSEFYVQALEHCRCQAISYQSLLLLVDTHSDWQKIMIRLLEQLAIKKEQREADFLLLSATERYEKFLQDYPQLVNSIANYHIASYLGITEVALSRIRKKMKLT